MVRVPRAAAILASFLVAAAGGRAEIGTRGGEPPPPAARRAAAPLFEANAGQCDPSARFVARGRGFLAFFTGDGVHFAAAAGPRPDREAMPAVPAGDPVDRVVLRFPGSAAGGISGAGPASPRSRYFTGGTGGRALLPASFRSLRRDDLWPGVDLRWGGHPGGEIEYLFTVAPEGDAGLIRLAFDGARPRIGGTGDLLLATARGAFRHGRPVAFEERDGARVPVAAAFRIHGDGSVGFDLGPRTPGAALVIDPRIVFQKFDGGSADEESWAVGADADGNVFHAGWSISTNLPLRNPYQALHAGGTYDGWVAKTGPRGLGDLWTTYLGGTGEDVIRGLAADAAGNVLVVGETSSPSFPVAAALQGTRGTAASTGFATKIAADGASLLFSTYLGGSTLDVVHAVALGPGGEAYLAGATLSTDFPAVAAAQGTHGGAFDAFAARLAADGSSLAWSTFLGGEGNDAAHALALGAGGALHLAGSTESIQFPDVAALRTTLAGNRDGFLASLPAAGGSFSFATYLGGNFADEAWGVAVNPSGAVWVVGWTAGADAFPLVGALDATFAGTFEGFAQRYAADGSALLSSTFLGGNLEDKAAGVAVDGNGLAYVAGITASANFPLFKELQDDFGGGESDAFLSVLTPSGGAFVWSTYHGNSSTEYATAVALDPLGIVLLAGRARAPESDAYLAGLIALPLPPVSLEATLVGLARVQIEWPDPGDATGLVVERRTGTGTWTTVKSLPPTATAWTDAGLAYDTGYSWRVRVTNAFGTSAPSPVATMRTLPYPATPPEPPGSFTAEADGPFQVELRWADLTAVEDSWAIDRYEPRIGWLPLAALPRNSDEHDDDTALPMRVYRYRLRALNPLGAGYAAAEPEVVMPASYGMDITFARRKDLPEPDRDSLRLKGSVRRTSGTRWDTFRPKDFHLELWLGAETHPLIELPAGVGDWKPKGTRWILRYPYHPAGKLILVVDSATDTFDLSLQKADLPETPGGPERIRLLLGEDGASDDVPWIPLKKPGTYRFP